MDSVSDSFFLFELSLIVFVGLVFGSFATALAHRIPRGLPWIAGKAKEEGKDVSGLRSCCPSCKAMLGPLDLVPVFSWVLSKGKCRHCKAPITPRYPIIEIGSVIACVGAYLSFGFGWPLAFVVLSIPFLIALLVIDIDEMILPNQLVLIVGLIGLARVGYFVFDDSYQGVLAIVFPYLFGAVLYGGLSWFLGWVVSKILKKDALGFGDVKFFTVAGLWLGISQLAIFCLVAGLLGIILALLWRAFFQQQLFPFGPALITSLYLLLVFEGSLFL